MHYFALLILLSVASESWNISLNDGYLYHVDFLKKLKFSEAIVSIALDLAFVPLKICIPYDCLTL